MEELLLKAGVMVIAAVGFLLLLSDYKSTGSQNIKRKNSK
jgi:hypothetical protein